MHASSEMRARTLSYYIMAYQGILPIGSLLIGFFAHSMGVNMVVFAEGVAGILIVFAFMVYQKHIHHNSWKRYLIIPVRRKYFR
jgi:hypothetical protein